MSWLCLAKPWKISEGSGQRVLSGRAGSLKSANSKLEAVPEHQCKQICKDFASTCEILWAPFCLNWFEWRRLRSITLAFKVRAAQVTERLASASWSQFCFSKVLGGWNLQSRETSKLTTPPSPRDIVGMSPPAANSAASASSASLCFSCQAPCQASFRPLPLGLKFSHF